MRYYDVLAYELANLGPWYRLLNVLGLEDYVFHRVAKRTRRKWQAFQQQEKELLTKKQRQHATQHDPVRKV